MSPTPQPRDADNTTHPHRSAAAPHETSSPAQPQTAPRSGAGALLTQEEFSVAQAIGGPRGVAESVLPTLLFVILYVTTRDLWIACGAAVAAVVIAILVRLMQRQSISSAIGGLLGVILGGVLALRTGQGSDFYTPGLVINGVAFLVLLITVIARHPLVGHLVAMLDPQMADWRDLAPARRVYTVATGMFMGLYLLKLLVQVPLLLTNQVAALGVAKIAMGLPAFAIVVYLTWLMHRSLLRRLGRDRASAPVEN